MADRHKKKDQKVEMSKKDKGTKSLTPKKSEKALSLTQSICNLENKLLEDDVKTNDRAKFAINKMIQGLKDRLKNS
jgi:hypothetical protein